MRRVVVVLVLAFAFGFAFAASALARTIVRVGPAANGKTTRLHVGSVLVVALPGSDDGDHWIVNRDDTKVLSAGTFTFTATSANPRGLGIYTLALIATAPGRASLGLSYTPIDSAGALASFNLTVFVSKTG
jgi:hypothetical protein